MSTKQNILEDSDRKSAYRIGRACDECRRRKVRCSGVYPSCHRCKTQGIDCHYKNPIKKRGPSKESLENRLHKMEALISTLVTENQPEPPPEAREINASTQDQQFSMHMKEGSAESAIMSGPENAPEYFPAVPLASHIHRKVTMVEPDPPSPSSASTLSSVEELTQNLENLAVLDRFGNLRYYGNSSGLYVFKSSDKLRHRSFNFRDSYDPSKYKKCECITNAKGRAQTTPPIMPPPDLANHLIDIYFKYCYPVLPVMHKGNFLEKLKNPEDPPAPILLNAIFAIASRLSSDPRVSEGGNHYGTAGTVFHKRAMEYLDDDLDRVNVETIQALLLLASHQYAVKKGNRSWITNGMAFRIAQSMGMNRNCDHWNIPKIQREERKRAFWCCYIVDRMSSLSYGRQLALDDREIDVTFPSVEDDTSDGSMPVLDYMCQYIKLCQIMSKILEEIYSVTIDHTKVSPVEKISKLHAMLHEWKVELPSSLQYEPQHNLSRQIPHLAVCQMHMHYYNAVIVLHRPYIPISQPRIPYPSLQICISAAYSILNIAESLSNEGRFRYALNFAVLSLLTSGAMFASLSTSEDNRIVMEANASMERLLHLLNDLDDSWGGAVRFSGLFDALSNVRLVNRSDAEPPSQPTLAAPSSSQTQPITHYNSMQLFNSPSYQSSSTLQSSYDNILTQSSLLGDASLGNDMTLPGIPLMNTVEWDNSFSDVPDVFQNWQNADVEFMDIVTMEGLLEM
ncbi:fungal-specific transcription factor domain-containing protein [Umbelopsis sp. AD052]|nr:fungal-specific transcription factor domain-containing protein [Umbelopsis sp. AD052]